MKAILFDQPGDPSQLYMGEFEKPSPGPEEILVKVKATALNRADTLQRKGKYPPPAGASPILGLEMAGEVVETGAKVDLWQPDDQVIGLLSGGGYAEFVVIHQDMAMHKPEGLSFEEAAAIPEVFLTAFQALYWLGQLAEGETVLIHAGASGVGTAAIQMAKEIKANIFCTASTKKVDTCKALGADQVIDYTMQSFKAIIKDLTGKKGVDLVIDFIGGNYFADNLDVLAIDGRMVMLALMGGAVAEADLRKILGKRLRIIGSTLRSRSLEYQVELTSDFKYEILPLLESGVIKPVIDKVYDWKDAAAAHESMENNQNIGKIVLKVS